MARGCGCSIVSSQVGAANSAGLAPRARVRPIARGFVFRASVAGPTLLSSFRRRQHSPVAIAAAPDMTTGDISV